MSEDEIQKLICAWLAISLPAGAVWHHSPNEGRRHVAFKQKLKTMGTRWGWPDLEIFAPEHAFHERVLWRPIFIEVKSAKGRATANQVEVHRELVDAGAFVGVARSIEDAQDFLAPVLRLRTVH